MRIDGRTLDSRTQETLRRLGVARILEGENPSAVARSLGMNRTTVYDWMRRYQEGGDAGLAARKRTGRKRTLTPEDEKRVLVLLDGKDPRAYGFEAALWTRGLVEAVIERELGVHISEPSVGRLLRRWGFTFHKPLRRAYERDPEAVKRWKEKTLPSLQKRAKEEGWDLFFLDEAGVHSEAALGKTWAPEGSRPEVAVPGKRQSINTISAASPQGAFWFQLYADRLTAPVFVVFLVAFVSSRPRPVMLVLDRHPAHVAELTTKFVRLLHGRLELHFLPPYAPDLNPDEFGWSHLKRNGPAKRPLRQGERLQHRVHADLSAMQSDPELIKSFFHAPGVGTFVIG